MLFLRFSETCQSDEGFEAVPYWDTSTPPVATVGFGTTAYYPGDQVKITDPAISRERALQLMQSDLYTALLDAQSLFVTFHLMNHVRQEVVCNMAYNMGKGRLSGFVKMIAACERSLWGTASEEMADSVWHRKRQVGKRSDRLIEEMRTGELST